MNRKQQRRERKMKNRENYFRNRRNWVMDGGPVVVMDDPTEEHVKALLMVWLAPRSLFAQINAEVHDKMKERVQLRVDNIVLQTLTDQIKQYQFPPGWSDSLREMLGRMSMFGAPTIKVW